MILLNKKFWNNKYVKAKTGWDVGEITTPLKEYFEQLNNKKNKILIPGCGNAYEAEYLFKNKFHSTFILDYSEQALNNFCKRVPDFPKKQILNNDFFDLQGKYDIIIEQTFFCAINLLFDDILNEDHPPFGGSKSEYKRYFEPYFNIKVFETAYNSIDFRKGRELFMILIKK